VEPLALRVFFPPQFTFVAADDPVELPLPALLSLPQADRTSAPEARTPSAAPKPLSFNSVPYGSGETYQPPPSAATPASQTLSSQPCGYINNRQCEVKGSVHSPFLATLLA
jgi:hypothetical protein